MSIIGDTYMDAGFHHASNGFSKSTKKNKLEQTGWFFCLVDNWSTFELQLFGLYNQSGDSKEKQEEASRSETLYFEIEL